MATSHGSIQSYRPQQVLKRDVLLYGNSAEFEANNGFDWNASLQR